MKNETYLDFLKRTDRLAFKLGCNVEELMDILDISRASLFSYRTGKRPISAKAWQKLTSAENKAGIKLSDSTPDESLKEEIIKEVTARIGSQLDRIEQKIDLLIKNHPAKKFSP